MANSIDKDKSLESWIWDAACSIRGAKEASKYKDFILPLIFVKRLCDVFDDELNRIAKEVGSRNKAFELAKLSKGLGHEPGMEIYDPCCGSAGLLIKCQLALEEKMNLRSKSKYAPLKLYGQEYTPETWAMANMNMIIHDMEGEIEIGDTFRNPKFRKDNRLQTFDRVVANPMWNQNWFTGKQLIITIRRKPKLAFEVVGGQVTPEVIPPVWLQPESRPESFEIWVLERNSIVAKNATIATDGKTYMVDYFNRRN